jgi:hypothetical protein
MYYIKLVVILFLFLIVINSENRNEGFLSNQEIKMKANNLYKNRDIFQPGVKYGYVKERINWIDPVIYDDVYKESLKNELSISNLENIFK